MERLKTNKNISEMGMYELAHNCCYVKDGSAMYRDFDTDIDVREFIGRKQCEGMDRAMNIIRSHMSEKEKVSSAEIISWNIGGKPYYGIKYKKVGEHHYTVGYGSYKLDYVINWLNECFEFYGEVKVSINVAKDTNVPGNDGWIPVEDRLPEDERMVLVTCRTKKGIRSTNRAYYDGAFWHGSGSMSSVTAWQSLPEPYKAKNNKEKLRKQER